MGFFEFLGKADFATLKGLTVLDVLLSSGILGLGILILGFGAILASFYGIAIRAKPRLPLILGLCALILGVVTAYVGFNTARANVLAAGGWDTVVPEELAAGAAFSILPVYLGFMILLLGAAGTALNWIAGRRVPKEEE
jgi:hypothetical protein